VCPGVFIEPCFNDPRQEQVLIALLSAFCFLLSAFLGAIKSHLVAPSRTKSLGALVFLPAEDIANEPLKHF
jgi:hypothetical protein